MLDTEPRATDAPEPATETTDTPKTTAGAGGPGTSATADSGSSGNKPDTPADTDGGAGDDDAAAAGPRRISLSVRTLALASAFAVLLSGLAVVTWMYFGEHGKLAAQQRQADGDRHAEQIALDYAVNAATMNFQDLNTWKGKLVKGTTPALNEKLTKAAGSMEQLLIPLQWTSSAQPLVAKVRSDTNGIYVVDTFVSVLTKTTQAPDNLQSTATYSITIDSKDNWQISDVGGIGAVSAPK